MLLELIFVLEAIAAPRLHVDRFLPPTPIRLVVNHKLEDVTRAFSDAGLGRQTSERVRLTNSSKMREIARRTLPAMFQTAAHAGRNQSRRAA